MVKLLLATEMNLRLRKFHLKNPKLQLLQKPEAAITTKTVTISDSIDNIAVAVNNNSVQLLSVVNYVIRNEYSNIDTKKLMDRYKAEKKPVAPAAK